MKKQIVIFLLIVIGIVILKCNLYADNYNGWKTINGKDYWYENGVRQGTYDDPKGVMGDGTIRGREIYDPQSDGWYWLDACFDGAKAVSKEVWMPYIYQNEDSDDKRFAYDLACLSYEQDEAGNVISGASEQIYDAIINKTGKWVRYDENGKMYKGFVHIDEDLSVIYPSQSGNTYYYDEMTGTMVTDSVIDLSIGKNIKFGKNGIHEHVFEEKIEQQDGAQFLISYCICGKQIKEMVSDSKDVLVVYFSRTGNTRPLAEYAAEIFDADLFEIKAKIPYTDADIAYYTDCRADKEQKDLSVRPEIADKVKNMEQYKTIVLGYPIWHGQAPRIIDTFMESYDFCGKTIIPFCTSASSGIGSSDEYLHQFTDNKTYWIKGKRFAIGTTKETFTDWIKSVVDLDNKESEMQLYIDDVKVPVIWEENATINELKKQVAISDILVDMSMYSNNEQVGSLNKSYTRDDIQITTQNGDIVLYNASNIVVFYGSNTWAYTRLGKINLPEKDVTELLSQRNVKLKITK